VTISKSDSFGGVRVRVRGGTESNCEIDRQCDGEENRSDNIAIAWNGVTSQLCDAGEVARRTLVDVCAFQELLRVHGRTVPSRATETASTVAFFRVNAKDAICLSKGCAIIDGTENCRPEQCDHLIVTIIICVGDSI
jgi:hypothetical protein